LNDDESSFIPHEALFKNDFFAPYCWVQSLLQEHAVVFARRRSFKSLPHVFACRILLELLHVTPLLCETWCRVMPPLSFLYSKLSFSDVDTYAASITIVSIGSKILRSYILVTLSDQSTIKQN
jgi:hypothetical protein